MPQSFIMNTSHRKACVLLMNDIHVSKDTIKDFFLNWNEALTVCKTYGISHIVIGGDLWQKRAQQSLDVLMAVRNAILEASAADISLTIAEGNHDLVDQEATLGYSHVFSEYPNVEVVDEYVYLEISDQAEIAVMSYFPENGSFCKRLKEVESVRNKDVCTILYIHQGISGALSTPSETDLPVSLFKGFDKVLVGHYHDRCRIPNSNVEYIGSSRQHNFGESPEKGYTIVYTDGSYEFIQNKVNTQYMTVEVNAEDLTDELVSKLVVNSNSDCKIKLKVKATSVQAPSIDKQKLLLAGFSKVEVKTEQTEVAVENHDFDTKFDKEGIKKEYVSFCDSKNINADMGLTYLSKISVECGS